MARVRGIAIPDVAIFVSCSLVMCLLPVARAGGVKENEMIYPLVKVLADAGVSGSMEISGACGGPGLPTQITITPATDAGNIVEVVKTILQRDSAMKVKQDRDGTVRMKEAGIPEDILKVKIRDLNFQDSAGLYVPDEAVLWIMTAPEMARFRKSHGVEWSPLLVMGRGHSGPTLTRLPHVSESLHDVTVSQALDYFLKTFPGIWVYKNCPAHDGKRRTVYFRFFNIQRMPPEYLGHFAGDHQVNAERSH